MEAKVNSELITELKEIGRTEDAKALIEEAFKVFDKYTEFNTLMSNTELLKGNYDSAVSYSQKALCFYRNLDEKNKSISGISESAIIANTANGYIGKAYKIKGQRDEFIVANLKTSFKNLIPSIRPMEKEIIVASEEAIGLLEEAINLNDKYLRGYDLFARAYYIRSDLFTEDTSKWWKKCINAYDKVITLYNLPANKFIEASIFMSVALVKSGKLDEGLRVLNLAGFQNTHNFLYYYVKSCIYSIAKILDKSYENLLFFIF